jgi:hypothetical protein
MNIYPSQYGSFVAVTPSDTTLISCRALYIGGAGNLTLNPAQTGAGANVVITAPPVGSIVPIELNQGRVMAATTATAIVALA